MGCLVVIKPVVCLTLPAIIWSNKDLLAVFIPIKPTASPAEISILIPRSSQNLTGAPLLSLLSVNIGALLVMYFISNFAIEFTWLSSNSLSF